MPNFGNVLMYGISPPEKIDIPEFIKKDPVKGEISDLIPKSIFPNPKLSEKEMTVEEVKAAKNTLKRAMEIDPDIKAGYKSKIAFILYLSMDNCAVDGDKMDWCLSQAEKIVNLIFNLD
jgi:hypothetical protein